jgi:hypothetical protein
MRMPDAEKKPRRNTNNCGRFWPDFTSFTMNCERNSPNLFQMNLQILAADIVARVHHSPDTPLNLTELVANLIRAEQERADALEHVKRLKSLKADKARPISPGDFYQARPDASASERRLLVSERTLP